MVSEDEATAPDGLGEAGRELREDTTAEFELNLRERRVLLEACRVADRLDALD